MEKVKWTYCEYTHSHTHHIRFRIMENIWCVIFLIEHTLIDSNIDIRRMKNAQNRQNKCANVFYVIFKVFKFIFMIFTHLLFGAWWRHTGKNIQETHLNFSFSLSVCVKILCTVFCVRHSRIPNKLSMQIWSENFMKFKSKLLYWCDYCLQISIWAWKFHLVNTNIHFMQLVPRRLNAAYVRKVKH